MKNPPDKYPPVLTVRDVMAPNPVTVRPDTDLLDAVSILLQHDVSGATVVGAKGELLGFLSEYDCLRVAASGEFYSLEHFETGRVEDRMVTDLLSVPPDMDIYSLAHMFLKHRIRRFPVVDNNRLVGEVTRRETLRGIKKMHDSWASRRRYPDYPSGRTPMRR